VPGNDKERYERQLEVLEMEEETLKGGLLQSAVPAAATLLVWGLARRRRRAAERRLEELQAAEVDRPIVMERPPEQTTELTAGAGPDGEPADGSSGADGSPDAQEGA
jgi:hypothetical protein